MTIDLRSAVIGVVVGVLVGGLAMLAVKGAEIVELQIGLDGARVIANNYARAIGGESTP